MGLSSSQARLLHLTGRMHQIEYKAAKLEAEKLQMANESRRVYLDYENALDATKIQRATLNTDGTVNYVDATYFNMKDAGYDLRFDGKIVVDDATAANYVAASDSKEYFIALQTGRVTPDNQEVNGVTEIYTADQLMNMTAGKSYRLMSDIDLSDKNWTSKTLNYGCTFDGNGHSITGLKTALFSDVNGGTITNLNISGNVSSQSILANNVHENTSINNVSVSGAINTTVDFVGALIGKADGENVKVENCSANANVISSGYYVGVLIGQVDTNPSQITNCSSSGSAQGKAMVGGLIGGAEHITISNSSSSASVHATASGSGSWESDDSAGGFIGLVNESNIINCAARGDVLGDGGVIGGFIGFALDTNISNSDSYGNVTANANNVFPEKRNVAGFISAVAGVNINNCNVYGTATSNGTGGSISAGFVTSNMSGHANDFTDIIRNCYSADPTNPFVSSPSSIDSITELSSPISNNITVHSPEISEKISVSDTNKNGKLFDDMKENGYILESEVEGLTSKNGNDTKWFTNMVNEGYLFIYDKDKTTGEYEQTSVSTDTKLQEVADEAGLRKAEAKYEADIKRIDQKDKKYDYDLAALDNERNAIKQEMETLKTVAKDNVERTFKLFS